MIKRVLDVSSKSYIHTQNEQLLIEQNSVVVGKIPIEDIGVLLLDHPAIIMSQAAIIKCQKKNVVVIFCDEKHIPLSITQPVSGAHSLHTKTLQQQFKASTATKKRLWQLIVIQKIKSQAKTLDLCGIESVVLSSLSKQVKSGDTQNHEAQASRIYWPTLFGKNFKRNPDSDGINTLLNYGYAVVRASVARAISGTGLHPALGVFHCNQYNNFCLADDLMEPFRPWVDRIIYLNFNHTSKTNIELNQQTKKILLSLLSSDVTYKQKSSPFFVAIQLYVSGFKTSLITNQKQLDFPLRNK